MEVGPQPALQEKSVFCPLALLKGARDHRCWSTIYDMERFQTTEAWPKRTFLKSL